jgi:hypothetical protein
LAQSLSDLVLDSDHRETVLLHIHQNVLNGNGSSGCSRQCNELHFHAGKSHLGLHLELPKQGDATMRGNELPAACRACILCGDLNHNYQDCPVEQELIYDICLAMSDLNATDIACVSAHKGMTTSEHIHFLNTAANSHMGIHKDCLQNCKTCSSRGAKVGNGQIEPITAVGDFHGMKVSKDL